MTHDTETLGLSGRTLAKRLDDEGHLASKDESRGRRLLRRMLEGKRRTVLHLKASFVHPD